MNKNALPIAAPCTADWRTMTPADGGRFCGDCKKVVRNLSRMTEAEARALLADKSRGDLCVRYLYDRDGNIFFDGARPREGLMPASLLSRTKRAALAAAAIALPLTTFGCSAGDSSSTGHSRNAVAAEDPDRPDLREDMGGAPAPSYFDAGSDANADAKTDGGADASVDEDGGAEGPN